MPDVRRRGAPRFCSVGPSVSTRRRPVRTAYLNLRRPTFPRSMRPGPARFRPVRSDGRPARVFCSPGFHRTLLSPARSRPARFRLLVPALPGSHPSRRPLNPRDDFAVAAYGFR